MTYRELYNGYSSNRLSCILAHGDFCPYGIGHTTKARQHCRIRKHLLTCAPCISEFLFSEVNKD